ncbi:gluconate 2-dehydrogenase subunit 3 family protein [Pedobacter sp. Leaf132]|uniref:gluconate 2-dehydrogenase subunit 3 family protein n=1 Tax=Pedobacter sp. Leaf132 TaxID=2876557 RepID=UPI001E2FD343|nr:gluconate 2-dehydrogenase subunit 3 family protein [Pedobacter sp. Leaf132]
MNRRTTIKGILALSFVGGSSFSLYRWISLHNAFNEKTLLSSGDLIADLAETIIPSSDTPGAKEASVHKYIINVITHCTAKVEQNKFLKGLESVKTYSNENFGKSFSNCNETQKNKILSYFEKNDTYDTPIFNKINTKLFGKSFFTQLKELTVDGYCLSQLGATKGLAYDYIPGNYKPCIALKKNQKSWATK